MPGGDSTPAWVAVALAIVNAVQAIALAAITRPRRVAARASKRALKNSR